MKEHEHDHHKVRPFRSRQQHHLERDGERMIFLVLAHVAVTLVVTAALWFGSDPL